MVLHSILPVGHSMFCENRNMSGVSALSPIFQLLPGGEWVSEVIVRSPYLLCVSPFCANMYQGLQVWSQLTQLNCDPGWAILRYCTSVLKKWRWNESSAIWWRMESLMYSVKNINWASTVAVWWVPSMHYFTEWTMSLSSCERERWKKRVFNKHVTLSLVYSKCSINVNGRLFFSVCQLIRSWLWSEYLYPKIRMLKPNHQRNGIRTRAFRKWSGHKNRSRALIKGLSSPSAA
jgi:hypothetical protein